MRARREYPLRTSGKIAKARTRLTIASDRLDCNQDELAQMQREVRNVLSKYMNLENELFEIRIDIACGTGQGFKDAKTIQIK